MTEFFNVLPIVGEPGTFSNIPVTTPESIRRSFEQALADMARMADEPIRPRRPDIVPPSVWHRIRGQEWLSAVGGWRFA
jgi:hypothetical protein